MTTAYMPYCPTFEERERYAFMSGLPVSSAPDTLDDQEAALSMYEAAIDFRGIHTAEDLTERLQDGIDRTEEGEAFKTALETLAAYLQTSETPFSLSMVHSLGKVVTDLLESPTGRIDYFDRSVENALDEDLS